MKTYVLIHGKKIVALSGHSPKDVFSAYCEREGINTNYYKWEKCRQDYHVNSKKRINTFTCFKNRFDRTKDLLIYEVPTDLDLNEIHVMTENIEDDK